MKVRVRVDVNVGQWRRGTVVEVEYTDQVASYVGAGWLRILGHVDALPTPPRGATMGGD